MTPDRFQAFLLFEGSNHEEWLRRTSDSRSAYASVRSHLLRGLEHPEELGSGLDPLSEDVESPWATLRNDETLRAEILQDVDRCMPESVYFRQPNTQAMLLDILFVFCKLNPDVGYRQGMHELLAPILWAIEMDAISPESSGGASADDKMLLQLCNPDFIEHDTFTLFGIIMQGAKSFYEQAAHGAPSRLAPGSSKPAAKLENPILTRIHRIFEEYLPHVDPGLARHLQDIDLIPQVFLMRWIRLLFGREFPFDDVLGMWDVLFAEDPSLELVDFVCLIMILRLHWDLIDTDYNTALTLLLRYPSLPDGVTPQTMVIDALYLRDHLDQTGSSHLIEKHSGRPLAVAELLSQTPLPASIQKRLGARLAGLSSPKPTRQSSNLESVLQDAAKEIFTRGEKWGINKAVRDAVEEVRKGVRDIQAIQTPPAPRRRISSQSRQSRTTDRSTDAELRLTALEQRTMALAKMLKSATDELWDYHKDAVAAGKDADAEKLKDLSIAIAKVQFAQVYLEDPSVPFATDEETTAAAGEEEEDQVVAVRDKSTIQDEAIKDEASAQPLPPPKESDDTTKHMQRTAAAVKAPPDAPPPTAQPPFPPSPPKKPSPPARKPIIPHDFQAPRPSLAQSSFSWMLGTSTTSENPASFVRAEALPPSDIRRRGKGFLFGDDDGGAAADSASKTAGSGAGGDGAGAGSSGKNGKGRDRKGGGGRKKKNEVIFEQGEETEEFDLGAMEEEKKQQQQQRQKAAREKGGGGA
ncbi:hypothetical protein MBLNU459_g1675t1 [Dothideomycetes sp. NU459]